MKKDYRVLLKSNPDKEALDSARVMEIQQTHPANIRRLTDLGKTVMAGLMGDKGSMRGILVMDSESREEAETKSPRSGYPKIRLLYVAHPGWAATDSVLP